MKPSKIVAPMYTPISKPPQYFGAYLCRLEWHSDYDDITHVQYAVCYYEVEEEDEEPYLLPPDECKYSTITHWMEIPRLTENEPPCIIDYVEEPCRKE